MNWFNKSVFYEIYVPSFMDGNNDGVGDFEGIISKLDYLKDLGITGIWLTPIFPSPKVDNGYDISDYLNIAPEYGTLELFDEFIAGAHQRGIKVIMDLVLNHTSDQHEWFKQSRSSKENPYRDFYIWQDEVPNNWESFFAGSAWEYDDTTNSYYYHAFAREQVDLNWSNPAVKEEMFKVVAYWLNRGVDGFRLDVINFLKTDLTALKKDNPFNDKNEQEHIFDKDQANTLQIIRDLRSFVNQWDDKYLLGEVGSEDLNELVEYVGDDLLHSVFNFNLGSISDLNVDKMFDEITKMEEKSLYPTVFFSSHDMSRHMTRLCKNDIELAKTFAATILTLKGIPFLYQGDELGMHDLIATSILDMNDIQAKLTYEEAVKKGITQEQALIEANKNCRDKSRSPIQWSGEEFAGFSTCNPWLNIASCYKEVNVADQCHNENSIYKTYQRLMKLRREYPAFYERYNTIKKDNNMLLFTRGNSYPQVLVILAYEDNCEVDLTAYKIESLLFSTKNRKTFENSLTVSKEALVFLLKEEV